MADSFIHGDEFSGAMKCEDFFFFWPVESLSDFLEGPLSPWSQCPLCSGSTVCTL